MKRLDLLFTIKENDGSYAESENDNEYTNQNDQISDDNIIVLAIPFSMNSVPYKSSPELDISTLFFIIKTKSGKIRVFYSSYLSEDEFDNDFVRELPFHVENNFLTFRIFADTVINSFTTYITDFIFDYNPEEEYPFSIKSKNINNANGPEKFYMSSDIFFSIKYIDNYIFEGHNVDYELSLASISGVESDRLSKIIMVDKIDSISAMVQLKKTTTYAIEFVVMNGEDKYTILSTFDLGKKFNKKKSKGITLDKLNDTFMKDSDQYLQVLSEFCKFNNIDKDYLIIKGKNKDNENVIFMINEDVRIEFEKMISEY